MSARDILLVDDDISYLHLLSIFLKIEGYDVVAASNGINALEILEKENFRMIITDFNMPGMDGLELATKVRERHSGTPVVLVTANAITAVIEESAGAGVSEIFTKPVDIERLVATIRSSLSSSLV